jgi:signal transduction histidine kinase
VPVRHRRRRGKATHEPVIMGRVLSELPRWLSGLLVGATLIAAVSGVVWALEPHASVTSLLVLYLLAVLPVAVVWGTFLAVVVSVASTVVFSFFFLPPVHSWNIADTGELTALAVFLVLAVVVSELASRSRREAGESVRLGEEQAALRRVATLVAQGVSPEQVFEAVTREVGLRCDADLARTERYEADGTVTGVGAWSRAEGQLAVGTRFELAGASIAELVRQTGRPARVDSFVDTSGPIADEARALGIHSSVGCPIVVGGRLWGVIAASKKSEVPFPRDTEAVIGEFTELAGTAIANAESRAELRASRARIVTASDETRRRIERDLHDGTQQRLVSLTLWLHAVEAAVSPQLGELKSELARVAEGLDDLMEELRETARGIHPAILAEGGLAPAVKTLARRCPLPVELDVRSEARPPEPTEVAAYFVVSEMLTNAAKHSDASAVSVDVEQEEDVLHIVVRDDGIGGADPARGSGLIGLKDRVEALGGAIAIDSPIGVGTLVSVRLPLSNDSSPRTG